ncbi:hypothetical protein A3H26_00345 [candidate division WWE3 bacterium RIFCSPLOWO2_12_FULL_36_10]|uniref:Small ribosomal subunit protein uS4 n=1 Tax=candidate division WWE3 bacterium RIFCSPLOWO2_12_FULL_36_10 TaxID=1802630 RepID=A0A1F4VGF0_UNCKA|nr:MAG: hypothetical protein A3H26_00345 [candidate division WWE3 bacterium RIFCSPLOWO2_12_FULL_36_10]
MARYIGPKCRLCRREGEKLYLKGARCESEKCAVTKKRQSPGMHGNSRSRNRISPYGLQFREKQKAKRIYGLLEKQFGSYVNVAMKSKGVTGQQLMQKLETRFDNMVYRSGFAVSRGQARQLIRIGRFMVNNKVYNSPSMELRAGDIIKPVEFDKLQLREGFLLPDWLSANIKDKFVKFERLPKIDDLSENINLQLIVEFYTR